MADISLGERIYIVQGIEQDVRTDGRGRSHYRPLELEANVVAQADGSARLHLGSTDVLVGVKVCLVFWLLPLLLLSKSCCRLLPYCLNSPKCSAVAAFSWHVWSSIHTVSGGAWCARQQQPQQRPSSGHCGVLVLCITRVQGVHDKPLWAVNLHHSAQWLWQ